MTIKSLDDAIIIRNLILSVLEQGDLEYEKEIQKSLMTFVVVGGGFAGTETAGQLKLYLLNYGVCLAHPTVYS